MSERTAYHDVRDALCKIEGVRSAGDFNPHDPRLLTDSAAFSLAPHVVRALRASIVKAHTYGCSGKHLHAANEDECVAAGVAALLEGETPS